jgi:hypothetical protein
MRPEGDGSPHNRTALALAAFPGDIRLMLGLWVALLSVGLSAAPAAGQSGPEFGIGFVHADAKTFFCRDPDPVEALACAVDQCHEMAPGQSCVRAAWCFPSGWSAIVRTWRDDLALPFAICGAPTEIAVQRTVAEYCRSSESVTSCDLTRIVDPTGFEHAIEGMQFPGGALADVGAAAEETEPAGAIEAGPVEAGQTGPEPVEAEPVPAE